MKREINERVDSVQKSSIFKNKANYAKNLPKLIVRTPKEFYQDFTKMTSIFKSENAIT